ncbi:MAG: NADH-quinone oxidoreductase subunit M, partial [Trebonia sp.]
MNSLSVAATGGLPWLTVAGGIPLLGAVVVSLLPVRFAKVTTLLVSVVDLVWVIVMATRFNTSGPTFQFTEDYSWIPQFGIHYALGVDGIALVLIGMTAVLMPVVVLASWHDADGPEVRRSPKTYFALMLALDTMLIGTFAATDVFLFYVFFEA